MSSPSMTVVTPAQKKRTLDDFGSSKKRRVEPAAVGADEAPFTMTKLTAERAARIEQLCREACGEDN